MLRLFRNLRMEQMTKKRLGKYLLYAAGEIILVVIGILIALGINNANQRHILREKEHVYLLGLQKEFQTSKAKLTELMRVNRENIDNARQLLAYMQSDETRPDEEQLSHLVFRTLAYDIDYFPTNSLLTEMINSGSLKDLQSDSLRIGLTTWIAMLDDTEKQEEQLRLERDMILNILRSDKYSLRTISDLSGITKEVLQMDLIDPHPSNLDLLESREFENNLLLFMITSQSTETNHYSQLLEEIDAVLQLLNQEIDKR